MKIRHGYGAPYPNEHETCSADGSVLIKSDELASRPVAQDETATGTSSILPVGNENSNPNHQGIFTTIGDASQSDSRGRVLIIAGIIAGIFLTLPRMLHLQPSFGTATDSPKEIVLDAGQTAGMLVKQTPPVYPAIAKAARVQGTIVLQGIISEKGTLEEVHVVSGPPLLQQAALDAVKTWQFRPYLVDGEPVKVEITYNIVFTLN